MIKLSPFLIVPFFWISQVFATVPTTTAIFNFSLDVVGAVCTVSIESDNGSGEIGSSDTPIIAIDPINLTTAFDETTKLTSATPFKVVFTECAGNTGAVYSFSGTTVDTEQSIYTISTNADDIGLVISQSDTLVPFLKSGETVTTTFTGNSGSGQFYLGYNWFGSKTLSELAEGTNVTSTITLTVAYE